MKRAGAAEKTLFLERGILYSLLSSLHKRSGPANVRLSSFCQNTFEKWKLSAGFAANALREGSIFMWNDPACEISLQPNDI